MPLQGSMTLIILFNQKDDRKCKNIADKKWFKPWIMYLTMKDNDKKGSSITDAFDDIVKKY